MTMILPDRLPFLSAGKQTPGSGKVCAEQAVNWLVSGRLNLGDETDQPQCVQPVLNALSIRVNDLLPDNRRGEMWPLIVAQPGTARPELEPVLSVRLAAWCATQVLDLTGTKRRDAKKAIEAAFAWCDNPCKETAAYATAAANAVTAAANAATAAANTAIAAYAAAYAAANAATATANTAYAAANAAIAAANTATAAATAAANTAAYADRLLGLLASCQAEHARITGHTPSQPDVDRIERLATLVGT